MNAELKVTIRKIRFFHGKKRAGKKITRDKERDFRQENDE